MAWEPHMSLSRLTLLPYVPHIAAGLLIAALLGAVGGLWLGQKLARGAAARIANAALKSEVDALHNQLDRQAQQHAAAITDLQAAHTRLQNIAEKLEHDRESIQHAAREQSQALRTLAARRPEIRQPLPVPAGVERDILCHWNRAKAAPGTDTATAAIPGCKPDAALPGAADAGNRDAGGDVGRSRPNDTPVPRVPGKTGAASAGRAGDAGQRAGVVLPGTQTGGHPGGLR
ncbi:hypothetical protein CO615_01790 [Lysobacteraceae bacterium NML75-0749]|nr:hypothetical protein CO615_01790 [Xanthomonadaceae bacterium NML75-0749]